MDRKLSDLTIHDLATTCANAGCLSYSIHPSLADQYDRKIMELYYKGKVSLTPEMIFRNFHNRINISNEDTY